MLIHLNLISITLLYCVCWNIVENSGFESAISLGTGVGGAAAWRDGNMTYWGYELKCKISEDIPTATVTCDSRSKTVFAATFAVFF